jgi:hypothetical protein
MGRQLSTAPQNQLEQSDAFRSALVVHVKILVLWIDS